VGVIRIRALAVDVVIGARPEERVASQTVQVDVELRTDMGPAAASDSLDDALDYLGIAECVRDAAGGHTFHLVEALIGRILEGLLALPGVSWARVRVRKFHLPGMGAVDHVELEKESERA